MTDSDSAPGMKRRRFIVGVAMLGTVPVSLAVGLLSILALSDDYPHSETFGTTVAVTGFSAVGLLGAAFVVAKNWLAYPDERRWANWKLLIGAAITLLVVWCGLAGT